ncbi:MAG: S-layer homology domain-containing protein [Oscillospiraceae bacterium]
MKKALSLLLTLSMVMSFFTVSVFAGDGSSVVNAKDLTVTKSADVMVGRTATLEATRPSDIASGADVAYAWESSDAAVATVSGSGSTATVTGVAAGSATITCTVTATTTDGNGQETKTYYQGTSAVTVDDATYGLELKNDKSTQTLSLAKGTTGTLEVTGNDVQFVKIEGETKTPVTPQPEAEVRSDNPSVATISGTTITAESAGSANIVAKVTYKGATYSVTLCKVTVGALNVSKTIVNGQTASLSGLAADIATQLKTLTGADTAPTVSSVSIAAPGSDSIFTLSGAADANVTLSNSLTVTAKAGAIGSQDLAITVTVSGGQSFTGTLTLKSDYAGTVNASQKASFTKEEFCLDSINSTIREVRAYSDRVTSYESTYNKVYTVTSYPVTPSSNLADWTEELIGYDSNKVAYRVNVSFDAAEYDLGAAVEDGGTPFAADDFEAFVDAVASEQYWAGLNSYNSTTFDYVTFSTVSASGKWALKLGNVALKTTDKLSASDFKNVTISVTQAGTYDIPFSAYYKYQSTRTGTLTSAVYPYYGVFRIIASADGDIQYEVSYNETVTFRAADFQAFYRTAASSSTATLNYVSFTDGQPLVGGLYTVPGKYTSSYQVTASNTFYVSPTGTQLALGSVTYAAASSPKTQYSVYLPFTAYGSSGPKTGVVEIVVNAELPFTDIDKDHTFYEYIKYVYNHGIMNGKTTTRFDAVSPVTRVQLVTTLYRMAGSPSTYNNKTLAFSDTKGLSTEFANAVKWAVANKIVEGYDDGTFQPNAAVTRQAMVTVLYRYAQGRGFDTSVVSHNNLARFKDSGKVASSMTEAVNWAVDFGLLGGNSAGNLNPTGSTTRGAAAKILAVFHDTYIG